MLEKSDKVNVEMKDHESKLEQDEEKLEPVKDDIKEKEQSVPVMRWLLWLDF